LTIDGAGNPAAPAFAPDRFERYEHTQFRKVNEQYLRLYYGLLSERYPGSLAILGYYLAFNSVFVQYDLATMALASLWSSSYPLPSKAKIRRWSLLECPDHEFIVHINFLLHRLFRINDKEVYEWVNQVAGTGFLDRLAAWGWTGWRFWWNNRALHELLTNGPDAPAMYRLFDTGRGKKPWQGARDSIDRAHQEVKKMTEAWRDDTS
jgi:dimethylaniline monooxygenase (N-oxide forming)